MKKLSDGREGIDLLEPLKWGTPVLRYRSKKSRFVFMQLTEDNSAFTWYDENKKRSVRISQINEVIPGQKTKVFQETPDPTKENASFSAIYKGDKTFDVVAKTPTEAKMWITCINFLISKRKEIDIRNIEEGPIIPINNIDKLFCLGV